MNFGMLLPASVFAFIMASIATGTASLESDGVSRDIVCYSGGKAIFEGTSNPDYPVFLGSQDDHVSFVDAMTNKNTRVGGNCIVRWAVSPYQHKRG